MTTYVWVVNPQYLLIYSVLFTVEFNLFTFIISDKVRYLPSYFVLFILIFLLLLSSFLSSDN